VRGAANDMAVAFRTPAQTRIVLAVGLPADPHPRARVGCVH
jgi:hypothetical protein